ncbi:Xaa-Pro aminopeptidase [Nitrincola iocasae]|jgi:Xaa-Pro aminopeptidase|uniref:Xaa-Pro aminopeptidase n=1 Tax=Nitrincola iocasae TaxID=2614693 RepID=A0A5J6L9K9_9GAMM|nr:Xaa-Pro aminopeptidase [Nitrincola iocasae]QEW05195.1 Xaa-Pro aminopeptidase [Nitrincola iocasae]
MKISIDQFSQRRKQLLQQLPENSIALIPAASMKVRNRDAEYAFRQDSDFYYLTGFNEPDALLVLIPGAAEGESILFCPPRDAAMEIWTGYRAGPEGCINDFGLDQAFNLDQLDEQMPTLINAKAVLCYAQGSHAGLDVKVTHWLNRLRAKIRLGFSLPEQTLLLDKYLHELRLFKSEAELQVMQQAAELSAQAHCRAMQLCQPGMMEYQLEAIIQQHCAMAGARFQAYSPIVGGGVNACILHYIDNDAELKDGDLVLIDAGCELDNYASDITRTFPVNGHFSEAQKALYQLVLDTQEACIDAIRPGRPWGDIHDLSVRLLTQGLLQLGLLQGDLDDLIKSEAYKPFYMHRIGHWLGMDVHDVGRYKDATGAWRPLQPGMVMTVEPGLYIAPDNQQVDPCWRGIGIRIEDDVVVTETGCQVLTAGVPKSIAEIEALMHSGDEQ